jgi:regulator of sirC expression with transglutaminase-like and TPR domain
MMMQLLGILVSIVMLASAERTASAQQNGPVPRLALIIGNSNYPDTEASLKEPLKDAVKDARALADELKREGVGFQVTFAEDLSRDGMKREFDRFYAKLTPGSVALVFFSGYAIQAARQSYIIPVDGQIWRETDVPRDGISLESILREMNSRGAKVKIAIVDASRRNPYERRIRRFSTGLAPVDAPTGSLVMYSSAPSTVVSDTGSEQRLFLTELVKQLRVPELPAEEVFNRTRMSVSRGTQGQQVPWVSNSLVSDFSFDLRGKSGAVAALTPPPGTSAPASPAPTAAPAPQPGSVIIPKMDPVVPDAKSDAKPAPVASLPASPPPASSRPTTAAPTAVKIPREDMAAIEDLSRKLRSNPNDVASLYRRGQLYAKNDDFPHALTDFDATIKLNPRDAEALNNRCWVRAMIGDLHAALQDCDDSLQIRPDFVDSLDSRGFVKLKIGQPQRAIADYDAALQLSARKASSLYGRGMAKLRIGDASGHNDIADAKAIDSRIAEEFARYGVR